MAALRRCPFVIRPSVSKLYFHHRRLSEILLNVFFPLIKGLKHPQKIPYCGIYSDPTNTDKSSPDKPTRAIVYLLFGGDL